MGRDASAMGEALGVTMESTSIIMNFRERMGMAEVIDGLDDQRQDEFVKRVLKHFSKLEKFAKMFKDDEFSEFVKKEKAYFKKNIEEQAYYEALDDELRDGTIKYSVEALEKQRMQNSRYDRKMILDGKINKLKKEKGAQLRTELQCGTL